jgi:DNA-directed RNA polymerase specialized sigma24 family protein
MGYDAAGRSMRRVLSRGTLPDMAVTEPDIELLDRARRYKQEAVAQLFRIYYPQVVRIAHGLSGRGDVAAGIVRFVMKRGLRVVPKWRDEGEPQRWFMHHTVLTARRAHKHPPQPDKDLFVAMALTRDADYTAFIRALRSLPMQQREAFILHHGERLNERYLAVAMDCSVEAARNHLRVAEDSLRALAGSAYEAYREELARTYAGMSPAEDVVIPRVSRQVARYIWPRRMWRITKWVIVLGLLATIAWAAWRIYPQIEI